MCRLSTLLLLFGGSFFSIIASSPLLLLPTASRPHCENKNTVDIACFGRRMNKTATRMEHSGGGLED